MADDSFKMDVFGPEDDDDFKHGPTIDVTPNKEEPESDETDGHILDDLLKNHKIDRSDKTKEDVSGSPVLVVVGLVFLVGFLIFLFF